jgi:hypothetical protein
MEYIGIGILIAFGLYLAPLIITGILVVVVGIFSVLFGNKQVI